MYWESQTYEGIPKEEEEAEEEDPIPRILFYLPVDTSCCPFGKDCSTSPFFTI